jgi:hypothetical protein
MSDLKLILRIYVLPVLIFTGFILNMLSFLVMRRLHGTTTSYYMAILGLVDCCVLVVGGINAWLYYINPEYAITIHSNIWCKLVPFLFYSSADLSVFIIVTMTAERFYAVWKPLQANKIFNKGKSRITILLLAIFCLLVNSHFLVTHEIIKKQTQPHTQNTRSTTNAYVIMMTSSDYDNMITKKNNNNNNINNTNDTLYIDAIYHIECRDVRWNSFYEYFWLFIDATIYSFLPFILLTIFNVSIIRYLLKAANDRLFLKQQYDKNGLSIYSNHHFNGSMKKNSGFKCSSNRSTFIKSSKQRSGLYLNTIASKNVDKEANACMLLDSNLNNGKANGDINMRSYSTLNTSLHHMNDFKRSSMVTEVTRLESPKHSFDLNKSKLKKQQTQNSSPPSNEYELKVERSGTNHMPPAHIYYNKKSFNTRITFMLIALNVTFCILSMPMVIIQIVYYMFLSIPDEDLLKKVDSLKAVAEILQYLNHSTNFFLYSLSGKTFRNETKAFLQHHFGSLNSLLAKSNICFYLKRYKSKRNTPPINYCDYKEPS